MFWPMDEDRQQIRSQRVYGKHMKETVFSLNATRFAVTNAHVMNHGIESRVCERLATSPIATASTPGTEANASRARSLLRACRTT
jgi:hypothetical protein